MRRDYHAPHVFHPNTTHSADLRLLLKYAGCANIDIRTIYISEPNQTSEQAVAFVFKPNNPTLLRLRSGFDDDFLTKLKPIFSRVYARETQNSIKKINVPVIIAIAQKP